jgi:hypothetical protein
MARLEDDPFVPYWPLLPILYSCVMAGPSTAIVAAAGKHAAAPRKWLAALMEQVGKTGFRLYFGGD